MPSAVTHECLPGPTLQSVVDCMDAEHLSVKASGDDCMSVIDESVLVCPMTNMNLS